MRDWQQALAALYEASPFTVRLLLAVLSFDAAGMTAHAHLLGPDEDPPGVGDHVIENFLTRNDQVCAAQRLCLVSA